VLVFVQAKTVIARRRSEANAGGHGAPALPFATLTLRQPKVSRRGFSLGREATPLHPPARRCRACTPAPAAEEVAALAFGIHAAVRNGAVRAVITQPFLEHMKRQGMRVREYRLAPGERVACTIRADDDAVVGRMQVPLAGVKRVDALQSLDLGDGRVQQWRVEDVPFDPDAGEVLYLPSAAELKKLPAHMSRLQLVAVDEAGEQSLGEYTFAHTPS